MILSAWDSAQGQVVGRDANELPPLLSLSSVAVMDTAAALADIVSASVKLGKPCCHKFRHGPGLQQGTHEKPPAKDISESGSYYFAKIIEIIVK